ncbi:MAG TPA: Hsp20/alpha crystallin family protein [Stellaceae bacterium]|nr:Hsp20/alpha crystallin family protein [Stellaceae bacterium]
MADQDIEVRRTQAPQASQGSQQGSQAARTPARMRRSDLDPFQSFRSEMDRMFDQLWRGFGLPSMRRGFESEPFWRGEGGFGASMPAVDVAEDDKAYHITAELPGLNEKDIEVNLSDDILTICGEKRDEQEQKDKNYHFSERRYGSFRRSFAVPQGIDRDKIEANFRNGVLALTLPKTQDAMQQQKKIEVKAQQ